MTGHLHNYNNITNNFTRKKLKKNHPILVAACSYRLVVRVIAASEERDTVIEEEDQQQEVDADGGPVDVVDGVAPKEEDIESAVSRSENMNLRTR